MADFEVLFLYFIVTLVGSVCLTILHTVWSKIKCNPYKDRRDVISYLLIASCTLRWYCISISFTIFNKWILSDYRGGFHFSTIYTTVHMFIQWLLSRIWYRYFAEDSIEPLSWKIYLKTAMPIGIATAVDIMLSNMALMYVTLTLYTVIKSSVLIWTFFWGVFFEIEKFQCPTFASVVCICIGLSLAVASSTDVSIRGVIMVLGASAMSGVRWALTQRLMVDDEQSTNIFVNVYRFVPSSALSMLVVATFLDGKSFIESEFVQDSTTMEFITLLAFSSIGGVIAFVLITTEVKLVGLLSSLSLGVLGQVKEVIQIALAMLIFQDRLNLLNISGIAVAMVGIFCYKRIKSAEIKEQDIAYQAIKQVEMDLTGVFDNDFGLDDSDDGL